MRYNGIELTKNGNIPLKRFLPFPFLLMGFTFVNAQILLIRELLVIFQGNELTIGVILGNWLLLEALGSGFLGRIAERTRKTVEGFALLQILLAVILPLSILLARTLRSLVGIAAGEAMGILATVFYSLLILAPISLCDGAEFTFGCKAHWSFSGEQEPSLGKVYLYEALGAMVGGICFTYLFVLHLNSYQIALIVGGLNLISASLLVTIRPSEGARPPISLFRGNLLLKGMASVLLVLILYGLFSPIAQSIHMNSLRRQWRGLELVENRNSIYGNIAVVKRDEQLTFFENGLPIASVPVSDITYAEELVHIGLLSHPSPKRILLVGGGIGGPISEILKHSPHLIDYVELDPLLIDMFKTHSAAARIDLSDSRVRIRTMDGRFFLRKTDEKYDVIILNLPPPSSLLLNRFYTLEALRLVHSRLDDKGLVIVTMPGSLTYLSEELINLNGCLLVTLKEVFSHVRLIPGDVNIFLSSPSPFDNLTPAVLEVRMNRRQLSTKLITFAHLRYKLDRRRERWALRYLEEALGTRPNHDFRPSAVFYQLALWNAKFYPGLRDLFNRIPQWNIWWIWFPLLLAFVGFFLIRRRWGNPINFSLSFAILSTGFTGMALDIIFILAFQSIYGYIYHWIGLLMAIFMVGLASGSFSMTHYLNRIHRDLRVFLGLEIGLIFLALLAPILLVTIREWVQPLILILSWISGYLVGAEFPLAGKMCLEKDEKLGHAAGRLYGLDLTGAWAGAIGVGIFLVPSLGVFQTCLLILTLKGVSFICLWLSSHRR